MRLDFYPRLAADGIRKNRRMFLPYILTCSGMVMMFYIIMYLAVSNTLSAVYAAETLRSFFALGSWIIAIFAALFLFYTNSFLIRRRKREFGLYNILGMGRRNIARILFWETLQTALISVAAGLFCGILFSKLAEMGLVYVVRGEVTFDLAVSRVGIRRTLEVFGVIFLLLLLNSIRQVSFASAVTLLRSESAGEKPPKGNLLFGLLGVILLAAAYYIAVSIKEPLSALIWFFVAVAMVIVATYIIMIAGSVVFCRLLQRNKRYYYKPGHFVSVASMVYRMKRNGAGLASICILATMVLVMMASTTCLYFGGQDTIAHRYPREINMTFRYADLDDLGDRNTGALMERVDQVLRENGAEPRNIVRSRTAAVAGVFVDGEVETDVNAVNSLSVGIMGDVWNFLFMPIDDYNAAVGTEYALADGEALVCVNRGSYEGDTLSFRGGETLKVAYRDDRFPEDNNAAMDITASMVVAVPDLERAVGGLREMTTSAGNALLSYRSVYLFDTGLSPAGQERLYNMLREAIHGADFAALYGMNSRTVEVRELEYRDYMAIFGAFFYLGIILSIVFLLAAVLIIYYKQVSEGYEDQSRFAIMRKVGMTRREIRKSINSQLLTVFFLPLGFAALHIAFAFPIIEKLLRLFNLNNVALFARTTAITVALFAIFYTLVYRATSNAYYNIVSGAKEE